VTLERQRPGEVGWTTVAAATTDDDGRVSTLVAGEVLEPGRYRLGFDTGAYFAASGAQTFFPAVEIVFEIADADDHYHVPLLLSPFGYTTYRGS
jgi:5-hydroxyisourate hydrolase